MKTYSLTSLLFALPLACIAADADTTQANDTTKSTPSTRDRISARIIEAYKEDPNRPMMVPKTGDKSITDLQPVHTPPPAPDSSESAKLKAEAKDKIVDLPAVTVKGSKETESTWEAKRLIAEADKKIEAEKERTKATDLDKVLNNSTLSVMGEADAKAREGDAKRRIHELEVKQAVAACATDPKQEEENKKLLKLLQDLEYQKRQH